MDKVLKVVKSKYAEYQHNNNGCLFSEYLYDYYSEKPFNLPEEFKDMSLDDACYEMAGMIDEE